MDRAHGVAHAEQPRGAVHPRRVSPRPVAAARRRPAARPGRAYALRGLARVAATVPPAGRDPGVDAPAARGHREHLGHATDPRGAGPVSGGAGADSHGVSWARRPRRVARAGQRPGDRDGPADVPRRLRRPRRGGGERAAEGSVSAACAVWTAAGSGGRIARAPRKGPGRAARVPLSPRSPGGRCVQPAVDGPAAGWQPGDGSPRGAGVLPRVEPTRGRSRQRGVGRRRPVCRGASALLRPGARRASPAVDHGGRLQHRRLPAAVLLAGQLHPQHDALRDGVAGVSSRRGGDLHRDARRSRPGRLLGPTPREPLGDRGRAPWLRGVCQRVGGAPPGALRPDDLHRSAGRHPRPGPHPPRRSAHLEHGPKPRQHPALGRHLGADDRPGRGLSLRRGRDQRGALGRGRPPRCDARHHRRAESAVSSQPRAHPDRGADRGDRDRGPVDARSVPHGRPDVRPRCGLLRQRGHPERHRGR